MQVSTKMYKESIESSVNIENVSAHDFLHLFHSLPHKYLYKWIHEVTHCIKQEQ